MIYQMRKWIHDWAWDRSIWLGQTNVLHWIDPTINRRTIRGYQQWKDMINDNSANTGVNLHT